MKKLTIVALSAFISLASWLASAVELAPNHPEFHVVQPGDTLWDISEKFLKSPWLWPEIWHVNDQVKNPHLIYPGDIISLVYIDGKPYIMKTGKGTIKLSPKARQLSADAAIATIPLDTILPFLTSAQVVTEQQINSSPYVIGNDSERLLGAQNNKAYVRGIPNDGISKYSFFRRGDNYVDPITKEFLGIEAIHIAEGQKVLSGDPATVLLKETKQELLRGDLAWASNDDQLRPTYFPRAPKNFEGGQIISVYAGVQQIGQYDIVVINRGKRENIEVGHVLSIYQRGGIVVDDIAAKRKDAIADSFFSRADNEIVALPDELAGRLMVFRTFEKVSLGLVLKASKSIHVLDKVKTPL
jgi:hypothetical protein